MLHITNWYIISWYTYISLGKPKTWNSTEEKRDKLTTTKRTQRIGLLSCSQPLSHFQSFPLDFNNFQSFSVFSLISSGSSSQAFHSSDRKFCESHVRYCVLVFSESFSCYSSKLELNWYSRDKFPAYGKTFAKLLVIFSHFLPKNQT